MIKCYFIGYCPNGYKLWSPEEKIILGRNVIFDETKFTIDESTASDWISEEQKKEQKKIKDQRHDRVQVHLATMTKRMFEILMRVNNRLKTSGM